MSAHPSPTASTSQQATPAPAAAAPRTKSKVYGSQLAKEGDVQCVSAPPSVCLFIQLLSRRYDVWLCRKYKAKYKDLKMKVKEIEKVRVLSRLLVIPVDSVWLVVTSSVCIHPTLSRITTSCY
jgi:hypothetical protein